MFRYDFKGRGDGGEYAMKFSVIKDIGYFWISKSSDWPRPAALVRRKAIRLPV